METADSLITSLIMYGVMLLVVFFSTGKPRSLKNFFKKVSWKKPAVKDVPVALLYAALLVVASIAIGAVFYYAGFGADLQKVPDTLKKVPLEHLFIIVTAAAIVEEIFFRGFLQPRTSLVFAAFVFAYFHIIYGSFAEMVGAFALGLILGKEFQQTRGLFAPMLSHFLYNALTLAVAL